MPLPDARLMEGRTGSPIAGASEPGQEGGEGAPRLGSLAEEGGVGRKAAHGQHMQRCSSKMQEVFTQQERMHARLQRGGLVRGKSPGSRD